jgi:putative nucleotidyltransferase with HDIG domain
MSNPIFQFCPQPPRYTLDWEAIADCFNFVRVMKDCPQDAVHHAEGDVFIHTGMVLEELSKIERWRNLSQEEREIVFAACLLHDVAKPVCTRHEEDGRITSRGHSKRGAIMARNLLWQMNVPFEVREQIVNLIRFHQMPFFLINKPHSQKMLFETSITARCDFLSLVTEADARGRTCEDKQKLLDNISLFVEYAKEQGCFDKPKEFANSHSRFLYFRKEDRDADYASFDDTICEVVLMSGLPGSGKDYFISENFPHLPVVSLDDIRRELKISPTDKQGAVIALAKERAKEFLRRKQSFVWNATNISKQMRELSINLFANYNARIRIVYLETTEEKLFRQNQERDDVVPANVLRGMLERWEVPDLTEAHKVDYKIQNSVS